MKKIALNLLRAAGAFAPFRMANRTKALIVTYHRFSHAGGGGTVSARQFQQHVEYLAAHYRLMPLSRLAADLSAGRRITPGAAIITIDDGYRDAYEIALPILRRYRAPATLFVVTDFLDRKAWMWTDKMRFLTAHAQTSKLEVKIDDQAIEAKLNGSDSRFEAAARVNSLLKRLPDESKEEAISKIASSLSVRLPELPPDEYGSVSWQQAREMEASGVEIGSHTKSHPILTRVSDSRLASEMAESRARLEMMLGHTVNLLCYPNGDYDTRVRRAAVDSGYKCAVTVDLGFNDLRIDPLRLRRMDAEAELMRFIQITSGVDQIKNRLRTIRA